MGESTLRFEVQKKKIESSGQDADIGRNTSLPHRTKRRITTNLKTINNEKCQKIKMHGTSTTKELKNCSRRLVGGMDMGS